MKIVFYSKETTLTKEIAEHEHDYAKLMDFVGEECVQIHINYGEKPSFMPDFRLGILFSSDLLVNNSSAILTAYKKKVSDQFIKNGIALEISDISTRAVPASYFNSTSSLETEKKSSVGSTVTSDYEEKSRKFVPVNPSYSFNRVIINSETQKRILNALAILQCEEKVFKEWGLYEIQPHPSSALSFYGPSGTGKTMAAEAIAEKLGKKILKVSYADVESKYHGEGPKMVKAIFLAAAREDAVLFFDEADSLLSKRLTNVSQGSEQAINSMRSELLIGLENYRGIVIFATNLVINYDKAFLTRLISIEFTLPDYETRKKIWSVHIKPVSDGQPHKLNIPLDDDINIDELAEKYEFSGREIRNAVISACVNAAMDNRDKVCMTDFLSAAEQIQEEMQKVNSAGDHTSSERMDFIREAINSKMAKEKDKNVSGDA